MARYKIYIYIFFKGKELRIALLDFPFSNIFCLTTSNIHGKLNRSALAATRVPRLCTRESWRVTPLRPNSERRRRDVAPAHLRQTSEAARGRQQLGRLAMRRYTPLYLVSEYFDSYFFYLFTSFSTREMCYVCVLNARRPLRPYFSHYT